MTQKLLKFWFDNSGNDHDTDEILKIGCLMYLFPKYEKKSQIIYALAPV